jgi:hypothetical protein
VSKHAAGEAVLADQLFEPFEVGLQNRTERVMQVARKLIPVKRNEPE